jgi:hypothetical protein
MVTEKEIISEETNVEETNNLDKQEKVKPEKKKKTLSESDSDKKEDQTILRNMFTVGDLMAWLF